MRKKYNKNLFFSCLLVTLTVTIKKNMSASTKLSTAVKALTFLAENYPEPKNSAEIAGSIGVNASKLRKILSLLVKNNIVESTQGNTGGFVIKKESANLNLQEVYCAIEDRKAFYLDVTKTNGKELSNTTQINNFFLDLFADIQVDIENKMSKISLKTIIDKTNE